MEQHAQSGFSPAFILGLGDNFYPSGVDSVTDRKFKTHWEDVFLIHSSLRVPWHVALGNHDYDGNPDAQIEFSSHPSNPSDPSNPGRGLWNMPAQNYKFSISSPLSDDTPSLPSFSIDFFCLNTCGVQFSTRYRDPDLHMKLHSYIAELAESLRASTATWKIVFAHHPMYTKGLKHGVLGRCLRDRQYTDLNGYQGEGYSLENVLVAGGVDAYITGHEHRLQYHNSRGVNNFVVGAAGYSNRFYGGPDEEAKIDWYDKTGKSGFLSVQATRSQLTFQYMTNAKVLLKEVVVRKE